MRSRPFLCTLALMSLVATVPACVVARWSPVAARPEALDARPRRTVRGYDLNGERVILQGATLSGDTLRGTTCVGRDPGGRPYCVQLAVPVSDLRALEVRHVNVPLTVAANTLVPATMGLLGIRILFWINPM